MRKCSRTRRIGLAVSMTLLIGCSGTTSPDTVVVKTCPVPRSYSTAEKAEAKREFGVCGGQCSELASMIEDASVLAQQARDCAGAGK